MLVQRGKKYNIRQLVSHSGMIGGLPSKSSNPILLKDLMYIGFKMAFGIAFSRSRISSFNPSCFFASHNG